MSDPKNSDHPTSSPTPESPTEEAGLTLAAEEVKILRQRAAERDEYLNLARRTQAEFENYQKRAARDREQERQAMTVGVMNDVLPVLDNLERALHHAQEAGEKGSLIQGVSMVRSQLLDLLRRHNVTPIDAQAGQPFDPNLHQALTQQPSSEYPPNTILMVVEQGYRLKERVLRPAKVVVTTGG